MPKKKTKSVKALVKKGVNPNPTHIPLLDVDIPVTNLKNAKRLMSKLISNFISRRIINQDAKDLCYMISVFVTVVKEAEIEERIKKLEEKIK